MHNEIKSLAQHTTTTTTTTNMIKFHTEEDAHDEDDDEDDEDDDASNDSIGRHTSIRSMEQRNRNKSLSQSSQFFSHSRMHTSSYSSSSCSNERQRMKPRMNDEYYQCSRSLEHRIEAAKKLVKKLRRQFPFYEVSSVGPEVGRVYCKVCKRYLGAVSSTLKNHANTQEHQQAVEEEEEEKNEIQRKLLQEQQTAKNDYLKESLRNMKKRKIVRTNKLSTMPQKMNGSEMSPNISELFDISPDLRDIELQPFTPNFSGQFENQQSLTVGTISNQNMYSYINSSNVPTSSNTNHLFVPSEMFQINSINSMNPALHSCDSYT